jgi:hypothetical protein
MKILLVSANPESTAKTPLGAAYLASYLKSVLAARSSPPAVTVELRSFSPEADPAYCAREIAASGADAVGFSTYVWNRNFCLSVARFLGAPKAIQGGVEIGRSAGKPAFGGAWGRPFIFAGGPEAGSRPEPFLDGGLFDAVVAGEGEGPFVGIVDALVAGKREEVSGLIDGRAARVEDLDELPSPYLDGTIEAGSSVLWELSRGCAFSCAYCYEGRGGAGVRKFGLERLARELAVFAKAEVGEVFVLDASFNLDPKRAKEILKLISRIAPDCYYYFEARPEFIDSELAALFASLECSVQIGLQSSDVGVCETAGRKLDPEDFAEKVGLLNEAGVVYGFDLMYGLPGEGYEGFRNSLDFALELSPNHLDIFRLLLLGGTEFAERAAELGLVHETEPPYALICAPGFSVDDMGRARTLAKATDLFYTRGRSVAWFKPLVALLGTKPSGFLEGFADYLADERPGLLEDSSKPGDADPRVIEGLQAAYARLTLKAAGLVPFATLVEDIIAFNAAYARLMLSPPDPASALSAQTDRTGTPRLQSPPFRLASTAELIRFRYPAEAIYEAGAYNLRELAKGVKPQTDLCVIYTSKGAVKTESMDGPYYTLLERLAAGKDPGSAQVGLKLKMGDVDRFVHFCLVEGILVPAARLAAGKPQADRGRPSL